MADDIPSQRLVIDGLNQSSTIGIKGKEKQRRKGGRKEGREGERKGRK